MNIEEAKKDIYELKDHAQSLLEQYEEMQGHLHNILNSLSKTDSPVKTKVENLISEYTELREKINNELITSLDEMLRYLDKTTDNILEFTQNIRVSVKIFNEMLESFEV